jgi:regulatory protein RepA
MTSHDDPDEEFPGYKSDRLSDLKKQLPSIISWEQFENSPIEKPREIVPGFIDAGQIIAGGGMSKAGKTFLAIQLAICCCSGTSFLGAFQPLAVPVLYVGFELSDYRLRQRIAAIAKHLGVERNNRLVIWNLRRKYVELSDFSELVSLYIQQASPLLVIIDPMYTLLGDRDENKVTDMTDLWIRLAKVQDKADGKIAMIVMHHFPKGQQAGKSLLDCFSGSGATGRFIDSGFGIREHESSEDKKRSYILDFELRDHTPIPGFVVDFDYPVFVRNDDKNPTKYKEGPGRPTLWTDKELLSILRELGECKTVKDFKAAVSEQLGMSRTQFYGRFNQLKEMGKISVNSVTGFLVVR